MKKLCNFCKLEKPLDQFYLSTHGKLGRRSRCIACFRQYERDNRERVNERSRRYYSEHTERVLANKQRWVEKNPEWRPAYDREYTTKNRERINQRRNQRLRKTGKGLESVHRRMARMKDAAGSFTAEEWQELCARYDNKCLWCGKPETTIDHVIPITMGGSNSIDNLQPLCKPCNSKKGQKVMDFRELSQPVG